MGKCQQEGNREKGMSTFRGGLWCKGEPAVCLLAGVLKGEKEAGRKDIIKFLFWSLRLAIAGVIRAC